MIRLSHLLKSRAGRNAAASYFAFFSIAGTAFLSIPIAVAYLQREEIGLWTVVNQIVQYLLWMDLGVGAATGRKMADAIANRDQPEINGWWTTTRIALAIQGAVVIAVGMAFVPFGISLFRIPEELRSEAFLLLAGSVIITGVSFPMKGVPGLMAAQERFHWIPLAHGTAPWINLTVFTILLHQGMGIRAYLWGMAISQLLTWTAFTVLVRTGPQQPRLDFKGVTRERFKSLFSFSLNLSGIALITAILSSIPAMVISRAGSLGGLGMVPRYNFTSKGPVMISNLVQHTTFAFYPRIQRLYVEGKKEEFEAKFRQVGLLCAAFGLIAGGIVLAGTRLLVEVLAGPSFFGGGAMTVWLAIGVLTVPLAGLFQYLRQISGNMGKTLVFAALKLGVALLLATPCYRHFGLSGVTAVFMLVPLIDAAYGYFQGAASCGCKPSRLCRSVALGAFAAAALITVLGLFLLAEPSFGPAVPFRGREVRLPGWSEVVAGLIPCLIGSGVVLRLLRRMRAPARGAAPAR